MRAFFVLAFVVATVAAQCNDTTTGCPACGDDELTCMDMALGAEACPICIPNQDGTEDNWGNPCNVAGEYLTIALSEKSHVIGVVTQGRHDYNQWVKSYSIQTSIDGVTFEDYNEGQVFAANSDRDTKVYNQFHTAVAAQYVRLVVVTWDHHVSMRADVLICSNN